MIYDVVSFIAISKIFCSVCILHVMSYSCLDSQLFVTVSLCPCMAKLWVIYNELCRGSATRKYSFLDTLKRPYVMLITSEGHILHGFTLSRHSM